jgi:hypothetical protein
MVGDSSPPSPLPSRLGDQKTKQFPFAALAELLEEDDANSLEPVREAVRTRMRWLYWQLRFYRNRFIIHANRPWQRGTTRSVYGNDFNLHTPTPPGWLSEEEETSINQEVKSLLHLAPRAIRDAPEDWWQRKSPRALLEVLFDHIGTIESKQDRERIGYLFGRVGGSLPTFQTLAEHLLLLVKDGTAALSASIAALEDRIDLETPAGQTETP